jgi:hypothetical protein
VESAKALAIASSGTFAGNQRLQVWTNDWIDQVSINVAARSRELRGLGWSQEDANSIKEHLIYGAAVNPSQGQSFESNKRAKFPDLSWDDSQVLSTAQSVLTLDPTAKSLCVTNDKNFRNTSSAAGVVMLTPPEFIEAISQTRANLASK